METITHLEHLAYVAGSGFGLGFVVGLLTLAIHLGRRSVQSILKVPGIN